MLNKFKSTIVFASYLLILIWLIEAVNFALGHSLNQLGIYPRDVNSLWHIFVAPFIHGFPVHALSNSVPLFILTIIAGFHGRKNLLICLLIIITFTGIMTWMIARPGYHLGASSLIFGLWGYLFGMGFKKRDVKSIVLATITFLLYGGLAYQLLHLQLHISWEGHFFGASAGLIAAFYLANKNQ